MSKLKAKTALNKLLKGETIFHSVYDEKFEPVQMINGQLINPLTKMEWAFSDFTQFYKTKEDGEKSLKKEAKISSKNYDKIWNEKEKIAKQQKQDQDKKSLQKKQDSINRLTPVLNELNYALNSRGLEFSLHTNESHYPCPAIHLTKGSQGPFTPLYELCREIYITDYISEEEFYLKSGSCNSHKNTSKNVNDLIEKIMYNCIQERIA